MKRKKLLLYILVILVLGAVGCSQEEKETVVTTAVVVETTQATETTIAEEMIEEAPVDLAEVFIPDTYEVYTDGQPHYLMYYSNGINTFFDTFTSVNRPDLGLASVSFLSRFIVDELELIKATDNSVFNVETDEDMKKVIDYTGMSWLGEPNGFARGRLGTGRVGIISREFKFEGEEPTSIEVNEFAKQYLLYTDPKQQLFIDTVEGEKIYSAFYVEWLGNETEIRYYGIISFRVKDSKAQGAHFSMWGDLKENIGYLQYMTKSLRFTE